MNYWLFDNREVAEQYVFHYLKGMLSARQKISDNINIQELLNYIQETANEEEKRLNKTYPEKARGYRG